MFASVFNKERVYLMIGVWLAVYPTVTLLTYLTANLNAPTFVRTIITTVLTVPFITFLVVPVVNRLIERNEPD